MIREYEQGKWLARITVNGKQKALYGNSEKEVAKKLKEFKNKMSAGVNSYKNIQYSDFLDIWLERKKIELKEQSYSRLLSTVDIHIKPTLGFYFIDKLDSDTIQNDVINEKSKKLSYSSLKKIYDALNGSFKFAVSKKTISNNPMELISLPSSAKMNKGKKDVEILSKEEIKKFSETATKTYSNGTPTYRNGKLFLFMLNTGVRIGEACDLKWEDYNRPLAKLSQR